MAFDLAYEREQAHSLLDGLSAEKLLAVRHLLRVMTVDGPESSAKSLADVPWEDEEISEEEERAVAESKAWLAQNPGPDTSHADLLAEYGLTVEDFDRMGETPLEPAAIGK